MRPFKSIVAILLALAVVLGLSLASVLREQRRLMEDFTMATRQQVHASAEALSARLDALDQDTRMLTDVVEHSGGGEKLEATSERLVWESAFRALAFVVAQYRIIALIDSTGSLQVLAEDPTETPDTVEALMPDTRRLALEVVAKHTNALGQTARYGTRSFLLYGTPVRGGRAIVVASDAAIFLGAVAWTPLPSARLFVTDPAGVVWAGCETSNGCRSTASATVQDHLDLALSHPPQLGVRGVRVVGPAYTPAVQVAERIDRPTGSWVVTWLASTQAILQREGSMVARVVLTAMAAAVAVAAVGAVVLHQQRASVELEGRLRYAQALASARETSQAIVENAPLGVLGLSQDGRVVLANRFLTERLGPVRMGAPLREALPGADAPWVSDLEMLLLPEGADSVVSPDSRSIDTGTHELRIRVVPVRNHELGVRTFALVEDQSELRNLEQQLVRAEKLITVGALSAGIAHEIGSPLAVIRGRAEQVLRGMVNGARAEDLRVIIKHIDQIASTIRQVLDFARGQPIERQVVSLDGVVERARALLQWKLEAKGVQMDARIDHDLPLLAADPDQLQQVLVNLLLNACDASADGQRVAVTARRARDRLVSIEVADHGSGIAPELMNAVFDPFFTTKKRGEGTGLGLSIASNIVRNHGGRIDLASTPGKGTTVTVSWPTASPAARRDRGAHA
jgi:two-component system sensor histidine kinase HydH